jgi:hypothetical protein
MLERRALNIEMVNAYGDNGLRVSVETGSLILEVPTVDALIEELGKLRSEMHPSVPQEISPTKQHLVEMDPYWHAEQSPLLDGSVVLFRHSGLGWTCFAIPRPSLEKLIQTLTAHLEASKELCGMPN